MYQTGRIAAVEEAADEPLAARAAEPPNVVPVTIATGKIAVAATVRRREACLPAAVSPIELTLLQPLLAVLKARDCFPPLTALPLLHALLALLRPGDRRPPVLALLDALLALLGSGDGLPPFLALLDALLALLGSGDRLSPFLALLRSLASVALHDGKAAIAASAAFNTTAASFPAATFHSLSASLLPAAATFGSLRASLLLATFGSRATIGAFATASFGLCGLSAAAIAPVVGLRCCRHRDRQRRDTGREEQLPHDESPQFATKNGPSKQPFRTLTSLD